MKVREYWCLSGYNREKTEWVRSYYLYFEDAAKNLGNVEDGMVFKCWKEDHGQEVE